jgi:DNA-binding transcriptional regulator LsrR (DeoR family)
VNAADPSADAAHRLIGQEEETAVAEAIESLPDDTREAVTLFYREGQSARQVGDLLGLSEVAVKKRLERARETLRERTLERLGELARKTAPGAGFTAAVVAALVIASPGTAAAAAAGAGLAKSADAIGPMSKVLAFGGGALLGIGSAVGATLFGMRIHLRRARDRKSVV